LPELELDHNLQDRIQLIQPNWGPDAGVNFGRTRSVLILGTDETPKATWSFHLCLDSGALPCADLRNGFLSVQTASA
jgi:hypothetical protein